MRMLGIRWHGRGGMGAKTAALVLAEAIIERGGEAQALPEFGPERRGAPVRVYTRIAAERIRERGPIERPDVIAVLDAGLLTAAGTLAGAGPATLLFVNTPKTAEDLAVATGLCAEKIITLDASAIARRVIGRDIPNMPLLAAMVAVLGLVPVEEFIEWIGDRLLADLSEEVVRRNVAAAREAVEEVRSHGTDRALVEIA